MTNILPPPVAPQDLAARVDVPIASVETPVVNRYVAPPAPEPEIIRAIPAPDKRIQTDPVIEQLRREGREKKLAVPITDVRVGRAVLLAAQLKGEMKQQKRLAANRPKRNSFDGSSRLV